MLVKLRHECGDGMHKHILNLIYKSEKLKNNTTIASCREGNDQLVFFATFNDKLHDTLEAVKQNGLALQCIRRIEK
jgi:hypothetical protein